MEHSRAYDFMIKQLNACGYEKKDGYYPRIMEEIYGWERDDVEDIIWNTFHYQNDMQVVEFLPKLRKYDGIETLKKSPYLKKIPSEIGAEIAKTLYEATEDDGYLDIIKRNIDACPDRIEFVAVLSYCKPCPKIENFLSDIYINSENEVNRSTAVSGLLYAKGIVKDCYSIQEINSTKEIRKKLRSDDRKERIRLLKDFIGDET